MKINKVGYDFHKLQCNTNSDDKERVYFSKIYVNSIPLYHKHYRAQKEVKSVISLMFTDVPD